MADPILYLSILMGLRVVYVLIFSLKDDGEKYSSNLIETYLGR